MRTVLLEAPSRSGSTFVRKLLNQHSDMTFHGELLGENRVIGHDRCEDLPDKEKRILQRQLLLNRQEGIIDFLKNEIRTNETDIFGFKLLYNHFGVMQNTPALEWLRGDLDGKVIFLWRENLLARYVSNVLHKLKGSGFPEKPLGARFHGIVDKDGLVRVFPKLFLEDVAAHEYWRSKLKEFFSGQQKTEISYEAICEDQNGNMKTLFDFIGLKNQPVEAVSEAPDPAGFMRKISNLDELQNWAEIKKYLVF